MTDPYRPLDDEARDLAHELLAARHGALGTTARGRPMVTRVACLWVDGVGMTLLLSDLSDHSKALAEDPNCALLVGEPAEKGDPLTHPRLTVMGTAAPADKAALRDTWIASRPKTGLYYDFTDFKVLRIVPREALLNGGFGKAYRFAPADLPG